MVVRLFVWECCVNKISRMVLVACKNECTSYTSQQGCRQTSMVEGLSHLQKNSNSMNKLSKKKRLHWTACQRIIQYLTILVNLMVAPYLMNVCATISAHIVATGWCHQYKIIHLARATQGTRIYKIYPPIQFSIKLNCSKVLIIAGSGLVEFPPVGIVYIIWYLRQTDSSRSQQRQRQKKQRWVTQHAEGATVLLSLPLIQSMSKLVIRKELELMEMWVSSGWICIDRLFMYVRNNKFDIKISDTKSISF